MTKPGEAATEVLIEGTVTKDAIELTEVRVQSKGAARAWVTGSATGLLTDSGRRMAGDGRPAKSTYQWAVNRVATPAFTIAGSWQGQYGGMPATLTDELANGAEHVGTLSVTTKKGKPATDIKVVVEVSGAAITLREVEVLNLGEAKNWSFGSGAGSAQFEGLQLVGTVKDEKRTYKWFFVRG